MEIWDKPINKHTDWGGDASTGNVPVSGGMVQKFIKDSLNGKAGVFYYDTANNRYLVFADDETRDEYLNDPTKVGLLLASFDAPFNYTAEINLATPIYNAVYMDSTGNYLDFTFDIKNKQGASTGENVVITYTFMRNASKQVISQVARHGESIHFNIDKYLGEGTNTIIIGIAGQTSLAATTVSVTYQVVNMVLTDETDISIAYDLSSGAKAMEVPFTLSGAGTKVVEWFLDGQQLEFVKAEDEVVDVIASRVKYITLANLQQGRHSLQLRAYTIINGEKFYTPTLYRDVIVYTGLSSETIIAIATEIPAQYGIAQDVIILYNLVQYAPYTLRFATYSPSGKTSTIAVKLADEVLGNVASQNGSENEFTIVSKTAGNKAVTLAEENGVTYTLSAVIAATTMKIEEITDALALDFSAIGRSNNSQDKASWSYGNYTGTFEGFEWNAGSGWADNRLKVNAGATFSINYAPLANTSNGKTIELEFKTTNVSNDDAVICDLRNADGVGLLITATKVTLASEAGVVMQNEFKADENVRIGIVINRATSATRKGMSFIYANGVVARCVNWGSTDNYTTDAQLSFIGSVGAEVELKAVRIYDAALSDDNMLNNFILYRDTISEMAEVYDRNDVYIEGTTTFSPDKMVSRLPVMVVTGDIPTLENTSDKDTQIIVDIEYTNMQDTSRSFKMVGAAMRPQGTSSMGYPKKNFRIYTQKVADTILYDANGSVVKDKLYSFKQGAIPVDCWCLKADYAESSGTHNTGIARMWNKALYNVQVDGEYVCRTEAQKAAISANYPYDVRTTIDGFPILLFYKKNATDQPIFIGKYNFNNDKSTEKVFGFTDIPGFDNSKMQCWEVLNNGNPLALFTTIDGFDTNWKEAYESRYPDTKTPNTADLKAFSEWMVGVNGDHARFATEKWEHFKVYPMAAYYCYIMRHAAVDQLVKNAMFTSEDGMKWYYILYDNDSINGLINIGDIDVLPTDNRESKDASGEYKFAGHSSVLWNMLEADAEFMEIVKVVDNALYSAGISYNECVKMFDDEQADKWVERVYNQDSEYKYVGPYVNKGVNNLFMLQGKRDLHRRWWLSKRFSIYDAKFVSGEYKSQAIELKCMNDTPAGQQFKVTAGYPLDYGYGINNVPRESGVSLEIGESHTFTTNEVVNLGDPIRIYGAPNIAELDLSAMANRLAVVSIANAYTPALGTKLRKFNLGGANVSNIEVAEISGLKQAANLTHLDIRGMRGIKALDLSAQPYFEELRATNTSVASVTFAKGAPITKVELPSAMRVLNLEQLPYLTVGGLVLEDISAIHTIDIKGCPQLSNSFAWVKAWYDSKVTADDKCSLTMHGIVWNNVEASELIRLGAIANLNLKGKVTLTSATDEQIGQLTAIFGINCFDKTSDFQIVIPDMVFIAGVNEIMGGESFPLNAVIFAENVGTIEWSVASGSGASVKSTGDTTCTVTVTESTSYREVVIQAKHIPSGAGEIIYTTKTIKILAVVRVTSGNITGPATIGSVGEYVFSPQPINHNKPYSVTWSVSGDAATAGYVSIKSQNNESCQVQVLEKVNAASFNVVATVNNGKSTFTKTKAVAIGVKMVLNIYSNQSGDEGTFANVKATVKYGSTTTTLGNGEELSVAANTSVTITFPAVANYKTPNPIEFVIGDDDVVRSGMYLTEVVEVSLSAYDGGDVRGAIVTINGVEYTWNNTPIRAKIAFDANYKISFSRVGDYLTPSLIDFTASQALRVIDVIYEQMPDNLIIIDQTITDPATMISGAVNNEIIQAIRAQSHRYLGKYTSIGQVTLCQLNDNDSNYYTDGTTADLTGTQGDVFMKMPDFWYRCVGLSTDIWGIQFQLGATSPGDGWIQWDGNALIGVYEATLTMNINDMPVVSSISNQTPQVNFSQSGFKKRARNHGKGYQLVDWQMHCVMAVLFYAQYGHTNCQEKIGYNTNAVKTCGQTNACGMNDTKGASPVSGLNDTGVDGDKQSINFWGIENWWGNLSEFIDNVRVTNDAIWEITEVDGKVRAPGAPSGSQNSIITKMMFGRYCDLIPIKTNGSFTTGFCDALSGHGKVGDILYRSLSGNSGWAGIATIYNTTESNTNNYISSRLAFRGQCVIENDVETFKSLTPIG